jgi:hypothetical protein
MVRDFLMETKVCVMGFGWQPAKIFWLVDLMLAGILKHEPWCNSPSENEKPTIQFVIRAYHNKRSSVAEERPNLGGFVVSREIMALS